MARTFRRDPGTVRVTADHIAQLPFAKNEFFGLAAPNDLLWTAAFVAPFASSPWQGAATEGLSGTRAATEGTNPPVVGGLANGYAAANFNGTSQLLALDGTVANYFGPTPTAFTVSAVFRADTLDAPLTYAFEDSIIIGDDGGIWGISASTSGLKFWSTDASGVYFDTGILATITTGTKYCVQARFDGSNIQARVDGGAWSTPVAVSGFYGPGTSNVARIGWGYSGGGLYHDGDIWEARLADFAISDTNAAAFWTYADARYAIASVAATATLAQTLGEMRVSATAAVRAASSSALTLGTLTAPGVAVVPARSTVAVTLGSLTAPSTAVVPVRASIAASLGALSCTSTSSVAVRATCDQTLGSLALAASSTLSSASTGTLDRALGSLGVTATAAARVAGSCAPALGLGATGTAAALVSAAAAPTLGPLAAPSTTTVLVRATSAFSFGGLSDDAQAAVRVSGSLTQTLGFLTVTGSATNLQISIASFAGTLGAFGVSTTAVARVGASLDRTLGEHRVAGTAAARIGASASVTVGDVRSSGSVVTVIRAQGSAVLGLEITGTSRVPVVASLSSALQGLRVVSSAILPPDVVVGDVRLRDDVLAALALDSSELAVTSFADQAGATLTFGVRPEPYDVGDTAKVSMTFTVDGVPTNPTTVTLEILSPSGTKTTVTSGFTTPSTGVYEYLLDLTAAGTWTLFATGTGAAKCAQPHDLFVRAKPF